MLSLALMVVIHAAPPAKKTPRPTPPSSAERKRDADVSGPASEVLKRLAVLYEGLDYDQVAPLATALLKREDLTIAERLEAYRFEGSAKAIVEDPVDAEKPFRMLLRARPDYDLPANTPPKILGVFRKVQSEEKALAVQLREVERARVLSSLRLIGEPPAKAQGGLPLTFRFRLKDPTGAVEVMRVPFRKAGQKTFSSLALERSDDGEWQGSIAGAVTADDHGFTLEYYVETADSAGPLLSLGTLSSPRTIDVLAGQVPVAKFKPIPKGAFWSVFGVTAVAGAAAGGLGIAFNTTQTSYRQLANGASEVDGAVLTARARQGEQLATATTATLIGTAALAVVTGVLIPFTNF